MRDLESVVEDYVEKMRQDYGMIGAMVTGSYVAGNMGPNSDIDIFFIWNQENKSMRGREFYRSVEFEYFASPEWKYYERLKSDLTSQQIYATGQVIFDANNTFKNIQKAAISILENYAPKLDIRERTDYSLYVETIMKDGIDMLAASELENFYFLSGMHIPKLCNIVAKVRKHYPVYEKYAMEHLKAIDGKLHAMIIAFYKAEDKDGLGSTWTDLCKYVLSELGNIDIRNYQVVTDLNRE
ncbi:MAG TPA: hypothetical protein GX721_11255 [Firmicutes bacterium]|jgi:predicted nucleotidyltransferase|nr:hypothetical protein [Bacillota bacterium]